MVQLRLHERVQKVVALARTGTGQAKKAASLRPAWRHTIQAKEGPGRLRWPWRRRMAGHQCRLEPGASAPTFHWTEDGKLW